MPVRGAATKRSAQTTDEPAETDAPEDPTILWTFHSDEFRAKPLATKLAAVMEQVSRVPKRGRNEFFKYDYVTEADLVSHIRPLLSAAGIIIVPNMIRHERIEGAIAARSGDMALSYVEVMYMITDGEKTITMTIPGYGGDAGDKGVYKALTGSMKYALMKLFMVSTGDDPEADRKVDDVEVRIESSAQRAAKGGHSPEVTRYQLQRISTTMRERGLPRKLLIGAMSQYLGELVEPEPTAEAQPWILDNLQRLTSAQAGELINYLEKVVVPDEPAVQDA